jgi:hypothetical protein
VYRGGNWKVWIPAAVAGYFIAGIAYYVGKFIANSNSAGGMMALLAFAGIFLLLATRSNAAVLDVTMPPGMLSQLPPLRVLAEIKDTLAAKYFEDKRWSLESFNEQKGVASFVCRFQEGSFAPNKKPKERIIVLTVSTQALAKATAVCLHYEVHGERLTQHAALQLCEVTTRVIETQLSASYSAV